MLKLFSFLLFSSLSLPLFSQEQNKNSFGVSAGMGSPDYVIPLIIGRGGLEGKGLEFGFNYYHRLSRKLKLETGLIWHRYQLTVSSDNPPFTKSHSDLGLVYIPMMMRINFSNHFFMNTGFLLDFDLRTNSSVQNQNGLGGGLGFGYDLPLSGKVIISITSYYNVHSVWVPKDNTHCDCIPSGMVERGIKIGVRTGRATSKSRQ